MLPYRLRNPFFGGQLKHTKEKEAAINETNIIFYSGGGPVQCAIEKDLIENREDFLQRVKEAAATTAESDTDRMKHIPKGSSFRVFQDTFANAKLGLIHAQLFPPRCDKGQYSQLVYASCLSLIQKAFAAKATKHNITMDHASYALFCLYVFFETSPLPRDPDDNDKHTTREAFYDMVTMGMHAVENPKIIYRRAFRGPIRIDRFHYSLLLQLREHSLAVQNECQSNCTKACLDALDQRMANTNTNNGSSSSSSSDWACYCSLATDTIHVLDRLWGNLELCEYTGPCSLEGLAGHADYPFPSTKPSTAQKESDLLSRQEWKAQNRLTATDIESAGTTESFSTTTTTTILSNLESYQSSLQSIQIPTRLTNQKTKRFQDALHPILQSSEREDTIQWKALALKLNGTPSETVVASQRPTTAGGAAMTTRQLRRNRHVSWSGVENEEKSTEVMTHKDESSKSSQQPQEDSNHTSNNIVQQDMSYDVVLPTNLPVSLATGIQKTLGKLLNRDRPFFLPTDGNADTNQAQSPAYLQENFDDVSSIGIGGVSVAQSSETGRGGAALKALLGKATRSNTGRESVLLQKNRNTLQKHTKPRLAQDFLAMDYEDMDLNQNDDADDSDASNLSLSDDDGEDDAVSVATSAAGKKALEQLLSAVHTNNKPTTARTRNPPAKKRKANASKSFAETTLDDEVSEGTSVGHGKRALEKLLSVADDDENEEDGRRRPRKKRATRRKDIDASSPSLPQVDRDDASDATSLVGKKALDNLLSAVNNNNDNNNDDKLPRKSERLPRQTRNSRRTSPPRRRRASDGKPMRATDDLSHTSVSSGQGKAAIDALLAQANHEEVPSTNGSGPNLVQGDDYSLASSVTGQGKAALEELLSRSKDDKSTVNGASATKDEQGAGEGGGDTGTARETRRSRTNTTEQSMPLQPEGDDDDPSVASSVSGQGRAALSALLSYAGDKIKGKLQNILKKK